MRTFFVWHRDQPDFLGTFAANHAEVLKNFPTGFALVARVEAQHEGAVFQLTNSIDGPWWDHTAPEVQKLVPQGLRSTSVGDVIVEVESEPAGTTADARGDARWMVDGIGLKEF